MSTWVERAGAFIASIEIPEDATLAERRRIVQAKASLFHGGTSWGQRSWAIAKRRYLEMHGQPPKHPVTPKVEPTFASDIIFPFR